MKRIHAGLVGLALLAGCNNDNVMAATERRVAFLGARERVGRPEARRRRRGRGAECDLRLVARPQQHEPRPHHGQRRCERRGVWRHVPLPRGATPTVREGAPVGARVKPRLGMAREWAVAASAAAPSRRFTRGLARIIVLLAVVAVAVVVRSLRATARATAVSHARAADASRRDADIAFYAERVAADSIGAADRGRLAALYLQRAREMGDFEDYRRAEALARRSLALRVAHNS